MTTQELLIKYNDVSINREKDVYNYLGINVSAQRRRQALVPWTQVVYEKIPLSTIAFPPLTSSPRSGTPLLEVPELLLGGI